MKKFFSFFILLFLLLSCWQKTPELPYLSENDIILAFGDSITYGVGAEKNESYPAILAILTKRTVVESGVPGETTHEGLVRLPEVLEKYNPKLVIICEGGNDMLRRLNLNETKENLRKMVLLAKSKGISVILIGVPQPGFVISTPKFYEEIAKEHDIPYEGKVLKEILTNNRLKADPIHPNRDGYRLLAERIFQLMRKAKAI